MSKNENYKECTICGKEYKYCGKCEQIAGWKFYACCTSHYQIWISLRGYREKINTLQDTVLSFEYLGITKDGEFPDYLDNILKSVKDYIMLLFNEWYNVENNNIIENPTEIDTNNNVLKVNKRKKKK